MRTDNLKDMEKLPPHPPMPYLTTEPSLFDHYVWNDICEIKSLLSEIKSATEADQKTKLISVLKSKKNAFSSLLSAALVEKMPGLRLSDVIREQAKQLIAETDQTIKDLAETSRPTASVAKSPVAAQAASSTSAAPHESLAHSPQPDSLIGQDQAHSTPTWLRRLGLIFIVIALILIAAHLLVAALVCGVAGVTAVAAQSFYEHWRERNYPTSDPENKEQLAAENGELPEPQPHPAVDPAHPTAVAAAPSTPVVAVDPATPTAVVADPVKSTSATYRHPATQGINLSAPTETNPTAENDESHLRDGGVSTPPP